jgi:hypothetical protein
MSSTKSSDDSQERKLTIMIIVIVAVFFLCNITGYSLSEALILFFCNRCNSLLSGPQLYNSEALPFIYDQYVVIELADKLYNSVTVCFCVSP